MGISVRVVALVLVWGTSVSGSAERCDSQNTPKRSMCSGCPPMYKGKPCASTTRYNDQTKAACGCGESDPVPKDWWTLTQYTAAMDCKNLHPEKPKNAWCPLGCGACYRLCSTGGSMHGHRPKEGVCKVFKITNRCGDGFDDYPMWCSNNLTYEECKAEPHVCKKQPSTNHYGYPSHFDLQDFHHQISTGLGWDNVEVTFEPVKCSDHWEGVDWDCYCDSYDGDKGTGTHHKHDDSQAEEHQSSGSDGGAGGEAGEHGHEETDLGASPEGEGECGKEWDQCGGKHFKGARCCQEGCYCKHLKENGNEHYSHQCIPDHWKGCKYSAEESASPEAKFEESQDGAAWIKSLRPATLAVSPFLAGGALAASIVAAAVLVRARRQHVRAGTLLATETPECE